MRSPMLLAFCLAPALQMVTPALAEPDGTGAAAAKNAPPAAIQTPAPGTNHEALDALRAEIERVRREAEEQRRQQEQRIQALEKKLQALQKPEATKEKPAAPAPNPVTSRPGFKARLYGFARADMDLDSRRMFSHPHLPFWALSPQDPRRPEADSEFSIHPRLTRVGLDTEAPPLSRLGDAKLTGKLEIDFFNFVPGTNNSATSNSRQFLRIRHAYGQIERENFRLLFGQTWDLISPLFPTANDDVLMWNAGNLGDRRPQFRATWEPKVGQGKATVAAAVLSAGAVDGANRDAATGGDTALDGEESGRPLVQVRLGFTQPASWVKGQNWELGLWGHNGEYRWDRARAIAGRRSFSSDALGLDARIPLTPKLQLRGEGWFGKGLADIRGGVGQSINPLTGEGIHAHGGWAELFYQATNVYGIGTGFTVDDPEDDEVERFTDANATSTGRTLNRTYYVANRFNFGSGLTLGVDWMLFQTHFRGLEPGTNNRWNVWLRHDF